MAQNILFSALSVSILTSIGQGFVIYIATILLTRVAPGMSAEKRYRFLYGAMLVIFTGFIISFVRACNAEALRSEDVVSKLSALKEFSSYKLADNPLSYSKHYKEWIAVLYLTGLFIQTVMMLAGFYRLQSFTAKSILWTDKVWETRLQFLCVQLSIRRGVKLHLSERIFSPFTAGFIKPVIIFPIAMLNRLSPEQVEAILLHELAHVKRSDYLLNVLHKIMETILFFNPFIWLLSASIRREREFACDDLVMKYSPDKNQYARALLHLAENKLKSLSVGIAASGNHKFTLLNRIKRLNDMRTQQNNPKTGLLALLCVLAAYVSLACILPGDTTKPESRRSSVSPRAFTYSAQPEVPVLPTLDKTGPLISVLKAIPPLAADTDTNEAGKYTNGAESKKQMEDVKVHLADMKKQFDSPEWKQQMQDMKNKFAGPEWKKQNEEMKLQFNGPEWKKHFQDIKLNSEEMKKHFESAEWKKQMQDIEVNAEQMKTHALAMQKEFDNPEWKKQVEDMKVQAIEIKKQFDSPEWKKKVEDMKSQAMEIKKQFDSPEWKKQVQEIKKMAEQMRLEADKADKTHALPAN